MTKGLIIFGQNIFIGQLRPILIFFLYLLKFFKKTVFKYLMNAYQDGIHVKLEKYASPSEVQIA